VPFFASIPSPHTGVIDIGPVHIHMYGLMLLVAIAACVGLTGIRWTRLGGDWDLVLRVAVWGVAFGIVGARVYHDITSWNEVPNHWWGAFAVWQGGLGVWGGILFGCIAGAVVIRRAGESVRLFADAIAPGLLIAQGIGRWGNWFNQELFGKPTDLPWGLEIDPANRPVGYFQYDTFHPTFLYECLWDLGAFGFVIWADRRFRLGHGRVVALYVMAYTAGRGWIEMLRIDTVELNNVAGLRFNVWTSIVLFVAAAVYFVVSSRLRPGREEEVYRPGKAPRAVEPAGDRPADGVSDTTE
jgi:prolipoprotein diacylglyceryl transferase